MVLRASPASAALAGVLASAGFSLSRAWLAGQGPVSALGSGLVWALMAIVLAVLPGWFLVVGAGQARFDQRWFKDPAEVARFMALVNRMISWFIAALVTTVLSAALIGLLSR